MVKVRCYRCGFAFTLTEQHISNMLAAEGIAEKPSHFSTECPRCRNINKISLARVRLPAAEQPPAAETPPEETA